MESVTGVVEKKGDKFNGSVLVNGNWLNFRKGVDHAAIREGETATFNLEPWEFKGKTGKSIVSFSRGLKVRDDVQNKVRSTLTESASSYKVRDFDKEARGKTFCQYLASLFSNPSFTPAFMNDQALEETFALVEKAVKRTFGE